MKYPGVRALLIGLAMIIGTLVVLLATDRLFYVVLIIGAISLLKGLFELLVYAFKSKEKKAEHHAHLGLKTVYQSMLLVAMADGKLDQSELVTMADIFQQLTAQNISPEELKAGAEAVGADPDAFIKELKRNASQVELDFKTLAVRAAVHISVCDGALAEAEQARVNDIAGALGFSPVQVEQVYGELLQPQTAEVAPA
ncbi:hypothetical protein Fbal_3223 [Ferrimonas balearica DSM 9799]|uniref:Co-chaperone DjlA N-terminal domain-containing protein n=1 Tax=Ferrimonas balearica (strain DSM 9799 / CCM 4581 / KCTC 23876 / PAT) TaxID=550540 RepID=E1SVX1_FERBD|nr:TerB family tellurite resistance protein [Ferrimonas balearica]ADN77422.1 hypothetical protein Fbal_3223 [Ferrimonas balearica DSM 9799]